MKKIAAVICEFNPLHEGHKYIISEAKARAGAVVCVMSGNFVQRGESAMTDKYERARDAALSGADLVVELPFPWCAAPAEFFARAGVTVASSVGADLLVFGSESGDVDMISRAAALSDDEFFASEVEKRYKGSSGFAKARYDAACELFPDVAPAFNSSNDMLAAEYIRQARKTGAALDFCAIRRIDTKSASLLREEANYRDGLYDVEKILFRLGKFSRDSFDSESGILRLLERASMSDKPFPESAKTKKYTDARLRRAALFAVTGVNKENLAAQPAFTVLLAANKKGRRIIDGARNIEVVTKPADARCPHYALEAYADRLYTLAHGTDGDSFLKKSPFIY